MLHNLVQRTIFVDLSNFDHDGKDEISRLIKAAGGTPKFAENSVELEDDDATRLDVLSVLADFNVEHREVGPDPVEPSNEQLNRFADCG